MLFTLRQEGHHHEAIGHVWMPISWMSLLKIVGAWESSGAFLDL